MGGFLATSKTITVKDEYKTYYDNGTLKNTYYQQAKVDVTINSAGLVTWTISMSNDRVGSKGRAVKLEIKIGTESIHTGYTTYSNSNDSRWSTYPTGNKTSKSGSFLLTNTSISSLDISVYVCCMQNSSSAGTSTKETLTRNAWTNVGVGTVTITDNGNNTFNISGTKGRNGTNNTAYGPTLKWSYDSAQYTTDVLNNSNISLNCSGDSRWVYAKCITTGERGDKAEVTTNSQIKRYAKPSDPGKPVLDNSSLKNNRLTVKQNWKYTWTAATPGTTNSPVLGYRIRIYKNGTVIKGLKHTSNGYISTGGDSKVDYVDINVDALPSLSVEFNPVALEFLPGQKVKISVLAWAKNGANTILWNGVDGTSSNARQIYSDETLAQNAGVVLVKHNGNWVEGQVLVKHNGAWLEAEAVLVKQNGSWQESTS